MRSVDVAVLIATLAGFVAYGVWRGRATRDLPGFLVAGRQLQWPTIALSVMATQASAVTFLATPGQGYVGGLGFVQFYFGLPLAMVVLCVLAVPLYQRLRVNTAYEFLERRFDGNTRTAAAALFLVQRGLAAGITLYAPALVLSVILGWELRWTIALIGLLTVSATTLGGARAVGHTHALQFTIIMATMAVAFVLALRSLPGQLGTHDALVAAGHLGKLQAIDTHLDPRGRYNVWAGLVGGLFLQLAYFGTDQSQVGRYLTARSAAAGRMALLFNGLVKVPMQFFVLLIGVIVFVTYQLVPAPLFFDPSGVELARAGPHAGRWQALESAHAGTAAARSRALLDWLTARRAGDGAGIARADAELGRTAGVQRALRDSAVAVLRATRRGVNTNDTNFVFLHFVLSRLPVGLVGLVLAAIFAAAMNSSSSEIHALASTSVVDVVRRLPGAPASEPALLAVSRGASVFWTVFAVGFAQVAGRSGSLVETVNVVGSLFYGTLLGIFLAAFLVRRAGGPAVLLGAVLGEAAVLVCWRLDLVFWLWFNVVGCLVTVGAAALFAALVPSWRARPTAMGAEPPSSTAS